MSIKVRLSSSVRRQTGGRREYAVSAGDVAAVIDALESECPGIKPQLCGEDGALRRFVMVFVDGHDVRSLAGVATKTPPGCEVDVVSAIAGG